MGIRVVAEGIETEEQMSVLQYLRGGDSPGDTCSAGPYPWRSMRREVSVSIRLYTICLYNDTAVNTGPRVAGAILFSGATGGRGCRMFLKARGKWSWLG